MLHYAVSGNHIDIVKLLLADERFTEINAKDNVSDSDNAHVCIDNQLLYRVVAQYYIMHLITVIQT